MVNQIRAVLLRGLTPMIIPLIYIYTLYLYQFYKLLELEYDNEISKFIRQKWGDWLFKHNIEKEVFIKMLDILNSVDVVKLETYELNELNRTLYINIKKCKNELNRRLYEK